MPRFNLFKAFTANSREKQAPVHETSSGYGNRPEEPRMYSFPRRRGLGRKDREDTQPEEVVYTPAASRHATVEEYYDDDDDDVPRRMSLAEGTPYILEPVRIPSPIPSVHREDSSSRLHEVFSEQGSYSPIEDGASARDDSHASSRSVSDNGTRQRPRQDPFVLASRNRPEIIREDPYAPSNAHLGRPWTSDSSSWYHPPPRGRSLNERLPPNAHSTVDHHRGTIPPSTYSYDDPPPHQDYNRNYNQDTYYIVPGGMNVIFQDEQGNEITRVGDFGRSGRRRLQPSPIIIQDEYGRELYRTGDFGGSSHSSRTSDQSHRNREQGRHELEAHRSGRSHSSRGSRHSRSSRSPPLLLDHHGRTVQPTFTPQGVVSDTAYSSYIPHEGPKVILIDSQGRQIPINPISRSAPSTISYGDPHRSRGGSHR